jgi:hypothetical protein
VYINKQVSRGIANLATSTESDTIAVLINNGVVSVILSLIEK